MNPGARVVAEGIVGVQDVPRVAAPEGPMTESRLDTQVSEWDSACNGTGVVQCLGCGGDQCVCRCGGEAACPGCDACDDATDQDDPAGGDDGYDSDYEDCPVTGCSAAVKPLLVGESNPYGPAPEFALYPMPEHSAGGRLCRVVLGLSRSVYLARFDRVNLCGQRWSAPAARAAALSILDGDRRVVVLCGSKVAAAFEVVFAPFTVVRRELGPALVVLPHPSGRCRLWQQPDAIARARAALRDAGALA